MVRRAATPVLQTTTLASSSFALPRDMWLHVALVHAAEAGQLRLFIDGKIRASADVRMAPLPHGDEAYVSVGRDGRWQRPLARRDR